jgi:endonuclease G
MIFNLAHMRIIVAFICLLNSSCLFGQDLFFPKINKGDEIINHTHYSLSYSEDYEQALWIAYELTSYETIRKYERTNRFMTDPMVRYSSADKNDYKNSGYDRGHLAPAADMSFSLQAMEESFYYSNMSPQTVGFNRGIWKKLEAQVRQWTRDYGEIQIATGPIIEDGHITIGPNKVAVPQYYYKVVLAKRNGEYIGIGFILRNEKSSSSLESFVVTIDQVEEKTGIDFFYSLDDEHEEEVESKVNQSLWSWVSSSTSNSSSKTISTPAVQCKGITQKGLGCKNKTKSEGGYCHYHVNQGTSSKRIK